MPHASKLMCAIYKSSACTPPDDIAAGVSDAPSLMSRISESVTSLPSRIATGTGGFAGKLVSGALTPLWPFLIFIAIVLLAGVFIIGKTGGIRVGVGG